MAPGAHNLPLAGDLQECLDRLDSLPAANLDGALQALLQPVSLCGAIPCALPALATLPLACQANLLLLLRAAPHRFCSTQRAAVLGAAAQLAASGSTGADLLQLLSADVGSAPAPVPPCPDFLYTQQPCFPWAPVLADAAMAASLQQQLAAAAATGAAEGQGRQQDHGQEMAAAAGMKRQADGTVQPGSPAKRQRQAAGIALQAATAAAGTELDMAVATVRRAVEGHAAGGAGALTAISPDLRAAVGTLLTHAAAGGEAGPAALSSAGLGSIADDALLLLLLQETVTMASSYARCSAAAGGLLLPRLRALGGAPPRDLAAAAEHVGSSNPQAYIAACLQPLLSSPGLNKHQAELLGSSIKAALPAQLLPDVLAAACAPAGAVPAGGTGSGSGALPASPGGSAWNEHTVSLLQTVLNAKPGLTAAAVGQLVGACHAACSAPGGSAAELAASAKFAKLVLSLVKQYPAEAGATKAQLQAVAGACKSFMAKTLASAVAKL